MFEGMNVPTDHEFEATIGRLKRALKAVVSTVRKVHDDPPGATGRCPKHVNTSQKRLCRAIKRGEAALRAS